MNTLTATVTTAALPIPHPGYSLSCTASTPRRTDMPPTLFRQIPTDTPGLQWTGRNIDEMREFLGDDYAGWRGNSDTGMLLLIRTREHLNEPFEAPPGSWVMQGTRGEHWAVAADVFPERYEPVDRSDDLIADSEAQGMEAHADVRRAEVERVIAASSLGAPGVAELAARSSPEDIAAIRRRVEQIENDGQEQHD